MTKSVRVVHIDKTNTGVAEAIVTAAYAITSETASALQGAAAFAVFDVVDVSKVTIAIVGAVIVVHVVLIFKIRSAGGIDLGVARWRLGLGTVRSRW